jgi:5'-3' exonuclease
MLVIDFSQVMLSNIMVQIGNHTNAQLDENMVRHMVLNSIRMYKTKFGPEYGELVIACDASNYWRRTLFPYYKANRKKSQAASELDWKAIFECLNKIRDELLTVFPYRVIRVDTAEADDIIGTLCHEFGNTSEKILIVSGDKDFAQLQSYMNVKQYNPVLKKFITCNDPSKFLKEHIIKGDSGDGIPNFLSDDNCLVVGTRQKPVTQKKLDEYLKKNPEEFCQTLTQLRNYKRNQQLIDLSKIPESVSGSIMEEYNKQANKKAPELMNYFIQHKLKNLMEHINEYV